VISFITVSQDDDKVCGLTDNLELALGSHCEHELLRADGNEYDLFTGYNWGAERAKGEILAFLHDDVRLLCNATSFIKPVEMMRKPMTGIVGVAGTTQLPKDGTWWKSANKDCRGMVAHPDPTDFGLHWNTWPHEAAHFGRVVICDGVLLMCSKKTFQRIKGFDSNTYQGFHFYDIDTCLRAHQMGLLNYVAPIPLLHGSRGRTNENWEENKVRFLKKHEKSLPTKI
jgi:GT2 family glycosyltransferase